MKVATSALFVFICLNNLLGQESSSKSNEVSFDSLTNQSSTALSFKQRVSFGVEIGYDKNYVRTDVSSLSYTSVRPLEGYVIAIPLVYDLTSYISIMANPGLARKSYQFARTGFYQGVYANYINTYAQFPVFVHVELGWEKLKGFLNAGGYIGYWTTARIKGTAPNILNPADTLSTNAGSSIYGTSMPYSYDQSYHFSSNNDNRIEYGWLAGAGIAYKLNPQLKLFSEARLIQSVSDQQKNLSAEVSRHNRTYSVSVGCLFKLSLFKKK